MLKLKRVKSHELNIDHEYYQFGNKNNPPLIMLPGVNSTAKIFENMKELGKRYNVFLYNFPEQWEGYKGKIDDFANLVLDFVNLMRLNHITLCGASHGGLVALRVTALTRSNFIHIEKLFLVSSFISGETFLDKIRYKSLSFLFKFLKDEIIESRMLDYIISVELKYDGIYERVKVKHADYYRQCINSIAHYNGILDIKKIYCPTVVIHGRSDDYIKPKKGVSIYNKISKASLILVKGGDHFMIHDLGKKLVKYFT